MPLTSEIPISHNQKMDNNSSYLMYLYKLDAYSMTNYLIVMTSTFQKHN